VGRLLNVLDRKTPLSVDVGSDLWQVLPACQAESILRIREHDKTDVYWDLYSLLDGDGFARDSAVFVYIDLLRVMEDPPAQVID
jgi:hypothetical protein